MKHFRLYSNRSGKITTILIHQKPHNEVQEVNYVIYKKNTKRQADSHTQCARIKKEKLLHT